MKRTKNTTKIICIIIAIFMFIAVYSKTYAADLSISAGNTTLSSGQSTTITISSEYTGRVNISATGGTLSNDKLWLENSSGSVTYTATSDGGGTITVTPADEGTMSNSQAEPVSVGAKSVTISGKSQSSDTNNSGNTSNQTPEKTPNFSSTNQTVYATGSVNIRSSYSTNSSIIGSLQEGGSITRTGVGDNGWSKVSYNGGTGYISSNYLTTEKKEDKPEEEEEDDDQKDAENTLKALEVTPSGLSPKFSPSTEKYTLSVNPDIEKLEIKATPTSDKAKVSITGNENLKAGENTVKITVTSAEGKTKTYTITVKKQEKDSAVGLTSLKLNTYTLTPGFSANVYEYNVSITDPNVDKLDLSAIANFEDAKVEITGNENLKSGKNTITITVTSADGENTTVYKIYADIKEANTAAPTTIDTTETTEKGKSKLPLYIGIGVIVLLILIMIIIILKNRRDNEEYDDEYDEENDEEHDEDKEDNQEDLYNFESKNFGVDDVDNSNIDESNTTSYDVLNENTNSHSESYDADDKSKLREEYLNQFNNYNPYTDDNIADSDKNKLDTSYSDLFGSYKEENNDEVQTKYQDEYDDYRPRRSKGKHSK